MYGAIDPNNSAVVISWFDLYDVDVTSNSSYPGRSVATVPIAVGCS